MNPTPSQPERPEPPENSLSDTVTVCDKCLQASCWQGIFMCHDSRTAGTVEKTIAELIELNREHPSYWSRRVATRTPAPEAVAGEDNNLICPTDLTSHWLSGSGLICARCAWSKKDHLNKSCAPAPTTPPADKDAEKLQVEEPPEMEKLDELARFKEETRHVNVGKYGVPDIKDAQLIIARKIVERLESDLTTARATIAERDAEIARMKHHESALEIQCLNQLDQLAERDKLLGWALSDLDSYAISAENRGRGDVARRIRDLISRINTAVALAAGPVVVERKPKVVCLCGSSKHPELHMRAMMDETLSGNIVIPMGLYGHADFPKGAKAATNDGDESTAVKQMLDTLHHRKIDASDEVLVLTVGNYIGSSTRREIEYAERTGKTVRIVNHAAEVKEQA